MLGVVVSVADEHIGTPSLWQYSPSTASTVLTAIVGATAALTGFVVTVTVLVVQMATGTFSARIMRLWFRDRMLKVTLAVLVGTLTFSFAVLQRIDDDFVPDLGVTLSGCLHLPVPAGLHRLLRSVHPPAATGGRRRGRRRRGPLDVRADRAPRRSAGHPVGVRDDARGSDARRASQPRRRNPGRRSRRSRRVGSRASRRARPAAPGRRLRAHGRSAGARLRRRVRRSCRRGARGDDRAGRRAHVRPGPRVRATDDGRHREQSALTRGERSHDRRPGPRPHRRGSRPYREDRLREAHEAGERRHAGRGRRW